MREQSISLERALPFNQELIQYLSEEGKPYMHLKPKKRPKFLWVKFAMYRISLAAMVFLVVLLGRKGDGEKAVYCAAWPCTDIKINVTIDIED